MPDTRPYQLGDVVDGHRWTVVGWERIDPPAPPEPAVEQTTGRETETAASYADAASDPVGVDALFARTVVAAPDLVVELDEEPPPVPEEAPLDETASGGATAYDDPMPDDAMPLDPMLDDEMPVDPTPEGPTRSRDVAEDGPGTTPLGAADPWRGFDWSALQAPDQVPQPAAAPDDDAFAAALALGAQALARREPPRDDAVTDSPVVNGHRWNGGGWEPIDEWTGSQPEPAPVIVLPAEPPVEAVVAEQRQAPVYKVEPFVTYTEAPAAGWYPGAVPSR